MRVTILASHKSAWGLSTRPVIDHRKRSNAITNLQIGFSTSLTGAYNQRNWHPHRGHAYTSLHAHGSWENLEDQALNIGLNFRGQLVQMREARKSLLLRF